MEMNVPVLKEKFTSPVFLPGESQGWGRTESDTTEVI